MISLSIHTDFHGRPLTIKIPLNLNLKSMEMKSIFAAQNVTQYLLRIHKYKVV